MNYNTILNYLNHCKTHKRLSPHTIRAYKNDLNQFYVSQIHNVEQYIEQLLHKQLKSRTLKRKIACLKSFYNYLYSQNIIKENPFQHIKIHLRTEKILPKTIPYSILEDIYKYLHHQTIIATTPHQKKISYRNFVIVALLLSTGLRITELCHIKLLDINLENRTLYIIGKGQKERMIFLGDPSTFTLLDTYINTYKSNSSIYLFSGKEVTRPLSDQSVRLILKNIKQSLNLKSPLTPHMFRHSFATMLLDSNIDIRYIQQILGHSSITVTQIYTHVSQNKQVEILGKSNPITPIISQLK